MAITDKELEDVQRIVSSLVAKEFERALGFPPPPMPETITVQPAAPCGCRGIVHMPGCVRSFA